MVLTLFFVTFAIAFTVCWTVARIFRGSTEAILDRIINDPISAAWQRYLQFAIFVVGISSGVKFYRLESYLLPQTHIGGPDGKAEILVLTRDRWILEVYRTIIGTLQGVAWMLLVFFVVALIAFVIVRVAESRSKRAAG